MLREPRVVEDFHTPPEFMCLCDGAPRVTLPLGFQVSRRTLHHFLQMMIADGCPVQGARLGYDSRYAFEAFALAHASGCATLRAAALELFTAFQSRRA